MHPARRPGPRIARPGRQLRPRHPPPRRPAHRGLRPPRLPPVPPRDPGARDAGRARRGPPGRDRRPSRRGGRPQLRRRHRPGCRTPPGWPRARSWPSPPTSRRCRGSGRGPPGPVRRHPADAGDDDPAWPPSASSAAWSATRRGTGCPRGPRRPGAPTGAALAAELAAIRTTVPPFDVADLAVPAVFGRGHRVAPPPPCVGRLADERAPRCRADRDRGRGATGPT